MNPRDSVTPQVLLVNLLIAMMSDTYTDIKENADIEWKFSRMTSVLESVERTHPVPPPVSLPVLAINFIQWAFFGRVWEKPSEDLSGSGKPDDWDVGGVLWVQKRKKEAAAKAAISELRKNKEQDDYHGLEQRVGRMEGLIQELLVHAEEDRDHREGTDKEMMKVRPPPPICNRCSRRNRGNRGSTFTCHRR